MPVTVIAYIPVGTVLPTASVSTLFVAVGLGLNDAVTPLGTPLVVSVTSWSKPFVGTTVMVLVPLLP